jgi:hypothetical protein
MSTKQINDLESADSFDDGDLMLVRKTTGGVDRKLTKDKLVESLGASAVNGYNATSTIANEIKLTAANGFIQKAYAVGMHISFISPIATSGVVTVKIDSLPAIELEQYNSATTASLIASEYVEAVYTGGKFKQTNKLNTNLIWSSEYNATPVITGTTDKFTKYKLTSAIGVKKPNYYNSMVVMFVVPENSQGVVFINVDDIVGDIPIGDGEVSFRNNNDFYKNRLVQLVYRNGQFLKYTMPIIEAPSPVKEEINVPIPDPIDPWSPSYTGNPDDPANANDPNSEDSQGRAFFVKTVRVGTGGDYPTLQEAFPKIINEYGDSGNGRRVAILLLSNYIPSTTTDNRFIAIQGKSRKADLRWISIFSEGNSFINFDNATLYCICNYTPIFNFGMSMNRSVNQSTTTWSWGFYISDSIKKTTVTFGKHTNIIFRNTGSADKNSPLLWGLPDIVALYGITINSTNPITRGTYLINKGVFTYENSNNNTYNTCINITNRSKTEIYNSNFSCNGGRDSTLINLEAGADAYLQNVESSDRTSNTKGIIVVGDKCTLNSCRFASNTTGTQDSGIDIVMQGNSTSRIILDSVTTGKTSQAIDVETSKGKIIRTTG